MVEIVAKVISIKGHAYLLQEHHLERMHEIFKSTPLKKKSVVYCDEKSSLEIEFLNEERLSLGEGESVCLLQESLYESHSSIQDSLITQENITNLLHYLQKNQPSSPLKAGQVSQKQAHKLLSKIPTFLPPAPPSIYFQQQTDFLEHGSYFVEGFSTPFSRVELFLDQSLLTHLQTDAKGFWKYSLALYKSLL